MSGKVKGEKLPLAAKRVVVEFKLLRAKGCKISKLWLKKKIKKRKPGNLRPATTGFKGSRSAITLHLGESRTKKRAQQVMGGRQFNVSIGT